MRPGRCSRPLRHKVSAAHEEAATDAGRVRVLRYNLDGPETLPLLTDMHGGGFILGHAEMDDPFMPKIAGAADVKNRGSSPLEARLLAAVR